MPETEFGPAPRGTGIFFSVPLAGAGLWLAWTVVFDLQLFSTGAQPENSRTALVILLVAAAFGGAAWAFWYYPWRASRIVVTPEALLVWRKVEGDAVTIPWADLESLSHFDAPRGAATLNIQHNGRTLAIAMAGFADRGQEIMAGIAAGAAAAGVEMEDIGPRVALLGGREWRRLE